MYVTMYSQSHQKRGENYMGRMFTQEQFENIIEDLGDGKYRVEGTYRGSGKHVELKHLECTNSYLATLDNFRQGKRCPYCGGGAIVDTDLYKKRVYGQVKDEYKVLGEYIRANKKISMYHKECGNIYKVSPHKFMMGRRCPHCAGMKQTTHTFRAEIAELHKNKFKVVGEYRGAHTKTEILHEGCGEIFSSTPSNLRIIFNCPLCENISRGEQAIKEYLEDNDIAFETQYRISECRNVKPLPFDFKVKLPQETILIEFDGRQHFEPVEGFGGVKGFEKVKKNDEIKNKYCRANNIRLVRIPYTDLDRIEMVMDNIVEEHLIEASNR